MPSEPLHRYEVAGTIISSTVELPGHSRIDGGEARWHIGRRTLATPESGRAYHTWRQDDGRAWLRFFRDGADRRLVFPGALDVLVSEARNQACCDAAPRFPSSQVQQLVAHQLLPLLLGFDRLVLHASAVAIDGQAVGFVAAAGAGKSTLASYLSNRCADAWPRSRVEAVADDALVIDDTGPTLTVVPYATPFRLGRDTIARVVQRPAEEFRAIGNGATAKHAVPTHVASARSLPLQRLYLLDPTGRGRCTMLGLPKAIAIGILMTAAFDMGVDDPARLSRTFDRLTRIAREVQVRRLRLPHSFDQLPEAADLILGHAGRTNA
jgi:hypothetical protein